MIVLENKAIPLDEFADTIKKLSEEWWKVRLAETPQETERLLGVSILYLTRLEDSIKSLHQTVVR